MKKILLFAFLALSFGMNAQTIQSVSPNTGNLGQRLQVTITGNDTQFSRVSDTYNVSIYNTTSALLINAISMVSDTELILDVTIPPAVSTGFYNLSIVNAQLNGTTDLANAFTVTNLYNKIKGHVGVDVNGNGCDALDLPRSGIKVKLNNGTSDSYAFTDNAGDYIFYVPAGNYVVTPEPEVAFNAPSPSSASFSFATENNLTEIQNFCLSANGIHKDLNIAILQVGPARPGFNATYRLAYKNVGNQTLSGTVNFVFDDARMDFISATATASQTTNNLNWSFADLLPFESRFIDVVLNINSPMETPPVFNGDRLPFSATISPVSGDDTPEDNTTNINPIVIGSYDPNDKSVAEGSDVNISDVGNYLNYLIRFQNSGTFAAENVVVRDVLSANLDQSTLEIVSASHPYRSALSAGGKLEFFFDNINLPTEDDNEPGSHGFIAFKIKPASTVGIGSVIENTADIYFDFNFPIVTNTVATTFSVLANRSFDLENGILLYPNPVDNILNIKMQSSFETASVKIFNQLGQLVKTANNIGESQSNSISVGDLKSGTYIVQITTSKGTSSRKLIKY